MKALKLEKKKSFKYPRILGEKILKEKWARGTRGNQTLYYKLEGINATVISVVRYPDPSKTEQEMGSETSTRELKKKKIKKNKKQKQKKTNKDLLQKNK